MNKRLFANLLLLFAMGLGLLTGWANIHVLNETAELTQDLFLRCLKLISLPIIFLAITSTITGMKNLNEMRTMGRRIIGYTLATTIVAASVALGLFLLIKPAAIDPSLGMGIVTEGHQASYLSFLIKIIPTNFVEAFTENNVMGIVFMAGLISAGTLLLPEEQKSFLHKLFASLFSVMLKVTQLVIVVMPLAIWAFVTILMKDLNQNFGHFSQLMLYLSCVVGANLLQGIIILPLMLKMKKISPWKSFRGMWPALTIAFFSKSSNAALPVTMQSAEKRLGVSQKVSSFSLPLCSVVNMNGCAAFILTTVLFVSTLHGMTFTPFELVGWVFVATLAAVGNAGVPMGCFFLTSAFLIGMDVPLNMMGIILPFYAIIDMVETALNVWSDSCITIAVDKDLAAIESKVPEGSEKAAA